MKTEVLRRLGAMVVLFACAATAHAAPVTYTFSGTVTESFDNTLFGIGDGFTGSFTYESAANDLNSNALVGSYDPAFSISLTIGGRTYVGGTPQGAAGVTVWNGVSGRDRFDASTGACFLCTLNEPYIATAQPIDGYVPYVVRTVFDDTTSSVFSGDQLPTSPLNLSSFTNSVLQLSFVQSIEPYSQVNVIGSINSLQTASAVPEASTTAMLAMGFGVLGFLTRRRRA